MGYGLWVIILAITYYLLPITYLFAWESQETVRVAIYKGAAVSVGGEGIAITGISSSNKVSIPSSDGIEAKAGRDGIVVNGTLYSSLKIESKEPGIKVNGKRYRGTIEIVRDKSSLLLINELNLEDYLVGLINQEISSRWPMEAVKAQAVVARTYALYQKKNRKYPTYDLESTVTSQVYSGIESEDELARQAVKETEGEAAYYNGEMIQALYHSSCGGNTEAALEVWGKEIPYLKSIKDPHCTEAPNYFWQYKIDLNGLRDRLRRFNSGIGKIESVSILKRSSSGRVTRISISHSKGSFVLEGKDFREALGYENIRSTDFTLKIKGDSVYLAGSGGGHGVGMCQWGAKGMAEDGKSYKDILEWYYPGITIKRMNGS